MSCRTVSGRMGVTLVACVWLGGGCAAETTTRVRTRGWTRERVEGSERSPPQIYSAHFSASGAPTHGGLDTLSIVFSEELDAASIVPVAFAVSRTDGALRFPREAVLAPSSEGDENRTVRLIGEFGDPVEMPPTDVRVIRSLYAESGVSLNGLRAQVSPYATRDRIAFAHVVARPCMHGGARLRTYWTDDLRGVEAADRSAIDVELVDGSVVQPRAFEDHRVAEERESEGREDNVLDLCLDTDVAARAVNIAAGTFEDPAGHLTDATSFELAVAQGDKKQP